MDRDSSVAELPSFVDYRTKFHALLRNKKTGMRFDANEWWEKERGQKTYRAAFRLGTSDTHQREFLSLWELFDETDEFKECLKVLARRARSLRPYTTIVICTSTARYMMELLHAELETDLERVRIEYLPIHPFLTPDRKSLLNFQGQRVLVFTDVIASGTLARHMSAIVSQLGGVVVGVLAVAVVGEKLLATQKPDLDYLEVCRNEEDENSETHAELEQKRSQDTIKIHFLTDFAIRSLEPNEFDQDKVIRIDPYSVYPEEATFRLNGVPTEFSLQETYQQWEETGAIAFDFFESDGSRLMTGLRLLHLFDHSGDAIWSKIGCRFAEAADDLGKPLQLVCTFRSGDILFKDFVTDRLKKEMRELDICYLHRRHDTESTDYFFVPESTRRQIENRRVILLLSAVSSSQTLREIVSILASCSVRRIDVVVLVNRMGPGACDFIDRIRTILSGLRHEEQDEQKRQGTNHASFSFKAVYSINDLQSIQIGKLQDALTTLFDYYEKNTLIPSFRSATQQVRKYFESQSMTTRDFATGKPTARPEYKLVVPEGDDKTTEISVNTMEGKFSLLCHALVTSGDYDAVIDQISQVSDRKALYKLFALFLLDLSHLRLTGQFEKLRECIWDRVQGERDTRIQLECSGTKKGSALQRKILASLEIETTMLLGLSMISYMDHKHDDNMDLVVNALPEGTKVDAWKKAPLNFLLQLAEERVPWAISMLLRLSRSSLAENCGKLVQRLHVYQEALAPVHVERFLASESLNQKITNKRRREIRGLVRRAKDNVDMLLTECGVYKTGTYHSCIRILHSHLLTRKQHSPIVTSLNSVCTALDDAFSDSKRLERHASGEEIGNEQLLRCYSLELQAKLEDAIHSVGIVEQIAEQAAFLFRFTPTTANIAVRYTEADKPKTMTGDLRCMRNLLLDIRRLNSVSGRNLADLTQYRNRIIDDLYDKDPLLVKTSKRYIVSIADSLSEATEYASELLRKYRYGNAWSRVKKRLKTDDACRRFVLVERGLLREILRNIATNIRHTFKGLKLSEDEYSDRISFSIDTEEQSSQSDLPVFIVLRIECHGNVFDEQVFNDRLPGSTWQIHQSRVSQFGGELSLAALESKDGTLTTLKLLSRDAQATAGSRDEESFQNS
jgi:hypoxanthine-guanine phosphoribosyltransferase